MSEQWAKRDAAFLGGMAKGFEEDGHPDSKLGAERLRQIASHIEAQEKLLEIMREALQAAKEELYQISHSGGNPDDESNMDSYAAAYRECKNALSKATLSQKEENE